jgi:hypothetical protein
MMRRLYQTFYIFLAIVEVLGLSGCSSGPFSGSAAMRIEVEVYKGPLSEEPETQWAALIADLDDARKGLIEADNLIRAIIANKDFEGINKPLPSQWPLPRVWGDEDSVDIDAMEKNVGRALDDVKKSIDMKGRREIANKGLDDHALLGDLCNSVKRVGLWDQMDHFDCLILVSLITETRALLQKIDHIRHDPHFEAWIRSEKRGMVSNLGVIEVRAFLMRVSELGVSCRDKAFRLAIAGTAGTSMNWKVRVAAVTTMTAAAEYGNQLKSRADALLKQIGDEGLDRRELPPGVALRDSNPTDFIELYRWSDAASYDLIAKYVQGIGSVTDRTKILARLFADHFWSKINTVYASGRGKVNMALIKDDVGNWNLKSFDNDPEELLNEYTAFSKASIQKAIAAVSSGNASLAAVTAASQYVALANQNAFGDSNGSASLAFNNVLMGLRSRLIFQLQRRIEELKQDDKRLAEEYISAHSEAAKKRLLESRQQYFIELQNMVEDYSKLVDSSVIPSATP